MSRGGRGGGRGGFVNAASKLSNGTLPFDVEADLQESWEQLVKSQDLFPEMKVPVSEPLSQDELDAVNGYRRFRAKIRAGPFYRPYNPGLRLEKDGKRTNTAARFDPFEDVPTWTSTHSRKRGTAKLSDYSFVKENFPRELWCAIGAADENDADAPARKKRFTLSTNDKLARFDERADENASVEEENEEREDKNDDKDEDAVSEQLDDDFSDDEELIGDDYDAEKYFDDGEGDFEDVGGDEGDDGY